MVNQLQNSLLGRFRIIAFLEGCSYLLLGFTMILKYKYLIPGPNYVVGMFHGLLFVLYAVLLIQVWIKYKWSLLKALLSFLASLIPFGTFIADVKLFRVNNSNPI